MLLLGKETFFRVHIKRHPREDAGEETFSRVQYSPGSDAATLKTQIHDRVKESLVHEKRSNWAGIHVARQHSRSLKSSAS